MANLYFFQVFFYIHIVVCKAKGIVYSNYWIHEIFWRQIGHLASLLKYIYFPSWSLLVQNTRFWRGYCWHRVQCNPSGGEVRINCGAFERITSHDNWSPSSVNSHVALITNPRLRGLHCSWLGRTGFYVNSLNVSSNNKSSPLLSITV